MSLAAALETPSHSLTGPTPSMSRVVPLGSEVPVPPPSAFHWLRPSRAISAATQVPMAK